MIDALLILKGAMTSAPPNLRAFLLLGLVMLFWGGNFIVGRAVAGQVPPMTFALLRWIGALAIMLPFAIAPMRREWAAIRRGWQPIVLLGLLGVAGFHGLLYTGLQYTTASNALLLSAVTPVLVVASSRVIFGDRINGAQGLAMMVSVVGVVVIVFEGSLAAATRLQVGRGELIVLAAALAWALYTALLRLRPTVGATAFLTSTFIVGALLIAPFSAWELASGASIAWSWQVVGAVAYVAILPSIVSYYIYNAASITVGPAKAGQTITLLPLFGALLSSLLLGEKLHIYHGVGMVLILAGIVLGAFAGRMPKPGA
jgi:drug/metabolite transporter (DMT)-like permease